MSMYTSPSPTHERRTANSAFSALATQQPAFRHFRRWFGIFGIFSLNASKVTSKAPYPVFPWPPGPPLPPWPPWPPSTRPQGPSPGLAGARRGSGGIRRGWGGGRAGLDDVDVFWRHCWLNWHFGILVRLKFQHCASQKLYLQKVIYLTTKSTFPNLSW